MAIKKVKKPIKKAGGGGSGSSQHYDGNPINARATDADWDEDIDDDMAFNSDDEKLFGHHFKAPEAPSKDKKMRKTAADTKKGGKKAAAADFSDDDDDADNTDMTGIFDRLNPVLANQKASASTAAKGKKGGEIKDDEEIGSDHFSDDSRSEIDLEEMLMTKEERRKANEKRKKKNKRADGGELGSTKTSKTLGGRAGATETDDFLLRQQEGLLIGSDLQENLSRLSTAAASADSSSKKAAAGKKKDRKESDELFDIASAVINPEAEKRTLSKSEMASIKALVAETEGLDKGQTATRLLGAVNNTKALLTEDIDDYEKTKQDRSLARELVGKSLKRYDGVLKEQKMAKHLRFPLEQPDADAVPTTLGGMAAAIVEKQSKAADNAAPTAAAPTPAAAAAKPAAPANSLAAKMQALLESSGLAMKKKEANDGSGAFREGQEGYVDIKERPEGAEENEGDENEFAMGGRRSGAGGDAVDRNYMAMLKAKLGYEIARRTRFNKIKSKTYRRILRKEEEREKARREQAAEILDPEGARRKRMEKMEKDRALERVTQKHKNTSKWVRHVKGIAKFDDGAKDAIQQQLLTHQRLMQKMDEDAGAEWEDYDEAEKASQAESEDEDRIVDALLNDDEGDEGAKKVKNSLFWTSSAAEGAAASGSNLPAAASGLTAFTDKARKELSQMGFMKKAKEREEKEMAAEVAKLKADIARYKRGEALEHVNDYGEDVRDGAGASSSATTAVGSATGRHRFAAPGAVMATPQLAEDEALGQLFPTEDISDDDVKEDRDDEENNSDDDEATKLAKREQRRAAVALQRQQQAGKKGKAAKVAVAPLKAGGIAADPAAALAASGADDELIQSSVVGKSGDGSDFVGLRKGKGLGAATQVHGESAAAGKSKRTRAREEAEEAFDGRDDAAAEAEADAAPVAKPAGKKTSTRITLHPGQNEIISVPAVSAFASTGLATSSSSAVSSSSSVAGLSEDENANAHQLQQEYLASRAFAKDDIDEDFLKMKEQQVEAIMKPKDKNATLPGWGEWGGESERLNTRHKSKVEQMELQRSLQKSALMKARADAKLDHVIISHEVDLVPGKYSLHMIPRPFSNAKEYALSMRQPVGPEWNTPMSFKETTQPRITTVQGTVIDPLDISTRKEKAKTKRRKVEKKKTL